MNELTKILNKNKLLEKYKDAIIKALEETLATIKTQKTFTEMAIENNEKSKISIEQFEKSENRYNLLKNKIESNFNLEEKDYQLLAISLLENSNRMINTANRIAEAAKDLGTLSKAFFSGTISSEKLKKEDFRNNNQNES